MGLEDKDATKSLLSTATLSEDLLSPDLFGLGKSLFHPCSGRPPKGRGYAR